MARDRARTGLSRLFGRRSPRRRLLGQAEEARAGGRYADAADRFEEALALCPEDARLRIQYGHMRKEPGGRPAA